MGECDKQEILPVKKIPLRDLPNENQNVILQPPQNSIMRKNNGNILESPKLSGVKRYGSDVSPNHVHQSSGADAISGRASNVRRKLEPSKFCLGSYARNNDLLKEKDFSVDKEPMLPSFEAKDPTPLRRSIICMNATSNDKQKLEQERYQVHGHGHGTNNAVGAPVSLLHKGFSGSVPSNNQQTSLLPTEKNELDTTASVLPTSGKENKLSWKDRYVQLQAYLKACDESSQDGYIQMLHSLSAAGRSKYAVELEKRAIHLLLEEGKELYKMKALNVLGRTSNEVANLPAFNSLFGGATPNNNL